MNILILQPYRPSTPLPILARARWLIDQLIAATPEHTFRVIVEDGTPPADCGPEQFAPHAAVRNRMLDAHLTSYDDYVLWIDVDLSTYPADFVRHALTINPGGITAPAVLWGETTKFYDICGYIERGAWLSEWAPYSLHQPGPVVELESVGCIYLIPAWLFREGARYAHGGVAPGVEHQAVCAFARERGVRVIADLSQVARHEYMQAWEGV